MVFVVLKVMCLHGFGGVVMVSICVVVVSLGRFSVECHICHCI